MSVLQRCFRSCRAFDFSTKWKLERASLLVMRAALIHHNKPLYVRKIPASGGIPTSSAYSQPACVDGKDNDRDGKGSDGRLVWLEDFIAPLLVMVGALSSLRPRRHA